MQLTFLGNCGVAIFDERCGVLIDAPNGLHTVFDAVPESVTDAVSAAQPPYDRLRGILFTHRHSDHYNKKRLSAICERRPELSVLDVSGATPQRGTVTMGEIAVSYETVPHSGEEFRDVFHRVLLIRMPEGAVYVTGDADWTSPLHGQILLREKPVAAIWNPNYVSHPEGRALLRLCPHNFVYHMPVESADVLGIGAKCRRSFERYANELAGVTLIDRYPTTCEI